jgi:TIR domain
MLASGTPEHRESDVATGEPEVDSIAPVFFLSYAQAGWPQAGTVRDLNSHVLDLFDTLSADIGELLGRQPGADPGFLWPGFMDRALGGGERWTEELLQAVSTSQVFVPLISPSQLGSRWCAMEWDAFSRRKVVRHDGRTDQESAIVPVLWTPIASDPPAVVSKVQMFSPTQLPPDYAAQYLRDGLYGLRMMGFTDVYRAVVWRLARRVVDIHRTHLVVPPDPVPTSTEGLRTSFGSMGEGA